MLDVALVPKDAMYELAKSLQTSYANAGLHSGGSCNPSEETGFPGRYYQGTKSGTLC